MAFTNGLNMARRKSDGTGCLIAIVAIGAIISSALEWSKEKVNQELIVIAAAIIIGLFILRMIWRLYCHKKWVKYLKNKYNNDIWVVNAIVNGKFWKEQSSEQLIDSIGRPLAIDTQVLKTKTKEIWKYNKIRKDQYALKITLENEHVVGWENKL
ncbi:MAG: hypothetical protein WCS87_20110 [Methylococcaceae bacterium]